MLNSDSILFLLDVRQIKFGGKLVRIGWQETVLSRWIVFLAGGWDEIGCSVCDACSLMFSVWILDEPGMRAVVLVFAWK